MPGASRCVDQEVEQRPVMPEVVSTRWPPRGHGCGDPLDVVSGGPQVCPTLRESRRHEVEDGDVREARREQTVDQRRGAAADVEQRRFPRQSRCPEQLGESRGAR